MRIGYACIPLGINLKTNRRFIIKNYSEEKLQSTLASNLQDLLGILKYNKKYGIHLFRISSDIVPFGSHEINQLPWEKIFQKELYEIGRYIAIILVKTFDNRLNL
ncbi:apurinic/apyrimidinic endonuclease family protein [Alkaliphilus hydrothermalis]|uniref:UV DNA damage repair endonuclease n=1 Tax=Alkaliphilus hydrothermalis TaxID=1482730 RepID=A0ABS2NN67_9FIRM|nr:hypothetical protein [Alkaliphilus hydrothermalis]MBM7614301.1 UV DNA damage repair endonuclease [Alkaliphilus hydrothermalis]